MFRKSLLALAALTICASAAQVQAQSTDDRWYIAPTLGVYYNDRDRDTDFVSPLIGVGFGRTFSDNYGLDFFVDYTKRDGDRAAPYNSLKNTVVGVAVRRYFGEADAWRPFLMAGAGMSHHQGGVSSGNDFFVQLGGGLAKAFNENMSLRTELAYRNDRDHDSYPTRRGFSDLMLNVTMTIALGAPPAPPAPVEPPPPPPPPPPSCKDLDDDSDGVNNCDDQCAATPAGTIVGPDGCPQKIVIDLRGVNFKFDRPSSNESNIAPTLMEPTAESIAILDQAVDVLTRYPDIRVEVAGHTDAIGADTYNQGLSERRAKIVADYLSSKGIAASRFVGPTGYGEARPIDSNDSKEGRQRNRRTELVVQ